MLKTQLPAEIKTIDEAKKLLTDLFNNDEAYHCEDPAAECLENATSVEAKQLDKLMSDIYNLDGNNNVADMAFDPCGFLLDL